MQVADGVRVAFSVLAYSLSFLQKALFINVLLPLLHLASRSRTVRSLLIHQGIDGAIHRSRPADSFIDAPGDRLQPHTDSADFASSGLRNNHGWQAEP